MKNPKYSVILGNLGNTRDRFCGQYKETLPTTEMLKRAFTIPDVTGIELVGTWDIRPDNVREMKQLLGDAGWKCVSIIPDVFTQKIYGRGAYSNKDPKIRRRAIDATREVCDIALQLVCGLINIWPGQDGYDYLLTADYEAERAGACESYRELAAAYPQLKFALEYKVKEPRTHSYLARMADTLLMGQATGCPNVGVCIDTGHAFMAYEVVGEQIVLAHRAGHRLFHMHFNDNHSHWDDDMIVGSVRAVEFLEILYWLDRTGYAGWLSMDQYPYREDAVGAIGESVQWLKQLNRIVEAHRSAIDELLVQGDAVATSRFLRKALAA